MAQIIVSFPQAKERALRYPSNNLLREIAPGLLVSSGVFPALR
jgi:hypothetical protein